MKYRMDQRGNLYGSSRIGRDIIPSEGNRCSDDPISKTETSDCCTVINSFIEVPGLSYPEFHLISSDVLHDFNESSS